MYSLGLFAAPAAAALFLIERAAKDHCFPEDGRALWIEIMINAEEHGGNPAIANFILRDLPITNFHPRDPAQQAGFSHGPASGIENVFTEHQPIHCSSRVGFGGWNEPIENFGPMKLVGIWSPPTLRGMARLEGIWPGNFRLGNLRDDSEDFSRDMDAGPTFFLHLRNRREIISQIHRLNREPAHPIKFSGEYPPATSNGDFRHVIK